MAETGHIPNRAYLGQDGNVYLNGSTLYDASGNDISAAIGELNALSAAELAVLDGVTAGTNTASKALVVGASQQIDTITITSGTLTTGTVTTLTSTTGTVTNLTSTASTITTLTNTTATITTANVTTNNPTKTNNGVGSSVAAAGNDSTNAGALPAGTGGIYPVTAADDTKGVKISTSDNVTGRTIRIANLVSNKILKVYPPAGGTINGAAANVAFSSASGSGVTIVCTDSTANTNTGAFATV